MHTLYCCGLAWPAADKLDKLIHFSARVLSDQRQAKADVVSFRHQRQVSRVSELTPPLPDNLCRIVQLSSEKGASSWLSVLPWFALHKGAFRDALCLRYGWLPSNFPAKCVCGHGFTVDHAMNCPSSGFPTLRMSYRIAGNFRREKFPIWIYRTVSENKFPKCLQSFLCW